MPENRFDLAIVGGGPGGIAAAATAAACGLKVAVLDEQRQPGGQIYRQPYAIGLYPADRFGTKHCQAAANMKDILELDNVTWLGGANVFGLQHQGSSPEFSILYNDAAQASVLHADRILVATGCFDMAVPFPGWTLPGVMGAGGIQAFLKGQAVTPGKAVVLAGSHPLLLVIAAQLAKFGCPPSVVIFSQPVLRVSLALQSPITALRNIGVFTEGLRAYLTLRRLRIPILFEHIVLEAKGNKRLNRLVVGTIDGRPVDELECDSLGVGFGFTASTELLRQIGAQCNWSQSGGGWIVNHATNMETTIPGLFVAGEVAGIGGAATAQVEGELAALSIARSAGKPISLGQIARLQRRQRELRKFASLLNRLADPGEALLRMLRRQHVHICRCECVSQSELASHLRDNPSIATLDAAKLLTRVGMGPCQGRFCHLAVIDEICLSRGSQPEAVGTFNARIPVRPVPLSMLASPSLIEGHSEASA